MCPICHNLNMAISFALNKVWFSKWFLFWFRSVFFYMIWPFLNHLKDKYWVKNFNVNTDGYSILDTRKCVVRGWHSDTHFPLIL